jgi:heme exporter protein C
MLLVMELGYLAIRRVPGGLDARARRCAVAALITAVDVPIVHFSVVWWHTLHQGATVLNANLSPTIHGSMAWTLLLGFIAFTLAFVWMLAVRMRIETLQDALEGASLELALDERWAEASGQVETNELAGTTGGPKA